MNGKSKTAEMDGKFMLDDLDKKILRKLQDDGTMSLRKLAEEIGASVSTIKNHYDQLIANQIIKKTSALIDCCKIGYHDMLIFNIRVNNSVPMQAITDQLADISRINFIYQVSGTFPIMGMAKCLDKNAQIDLLETVKQIPGIEEVTTQVVLRRIKEDLVLEIP
jgi:Lrp/AsnC family leucine-responsive transcriptional regulator